MDLAIHRIGAFQLLAILGLNAWRRTRGHNSSGYPGLAAAPWTPTVLDDDVASPSRHREFLGLIERVSCPWPLEKSTN